MRLDIKFYEQSALSVAKELLGKHLVRKIGRHRIITKIVETEAYCGPEDKACHAFDNRRTSRTETMFMPGGHAYIYLIYGLNHCLNIVTEKSDVPHAVLIRAVEPVEGLDLIKKNRPLIKNIYDFTNGPGKLTKALNIDMNLNGYDIIKGTELYIENNPEISEISIVKTKRVNIDYAGEFKDKPWRFYIKDNPFVSKK
ncbi:MAG TPA: DNA-3-methyladenine glycosylase [bacterium]|nr:DNA-3-methyladenine glycosylase [bacterium]